jgi:cytidylate kinase
VIIWLNGPFGGGKTATAHAMCERDEVSALSAALGADVDAVGVLLTAGDSTAAERLAQREIGSGLDAALERSEAAAVELQAAASASVHRIATDHRTVRDIAAELLSLSGWTGPRLQCLPGVR